jgi:hypothetical protein
VEVFHPRSVTAERVERNAVREMTARGMTELTGEKDEAAAWKRFFKPTDRVGIKVGPVGKPKSISQPETILEIIRGLNLAGVKNTRSSCSIATRTTSSAQATTRSPRRE